MYQMMWKLLSNMKPVWKRECNRRWDRVVRRKQTAYRRKKRQDARKEGNIFQSRDVATVVILAGIFFGIRIWLPFIYGQMKNYMTWVIDGAARSSEDMLSASLVFVTLSVFLKCALPLLLLALLLGIVAHGVQTRFNVSFKSIRPKWNRLNPLSGIKRLFSMKNAVELVKNSIKITLLLVLLYNILKQDLQPWHQ